MILVTGAGGTIGRSLLPLLARRGARLRAMTRDPARLHWAGTAAEVVEADFEDHASLRRAVKGVDSVFLLTAPGARAPKHDLALIQVASTYGIRKIVKLSAIGEHEPDGRTNQSDWHAPGEQALTASGLAWIALRPAWFASNALHWADAIRAGEPVPNMTGTGRQGVIDPRDIAAVAAEVLLTDDHDGAAYTLTGPELISIPDQIAQLSEELGRPIETIDVPPDAAGQHMLAAGMDASVVDGAVRGFHHVRAGGNALVTNDVRRILGHPPRAFRTWAHDHRTAFLT